MTESTSPTRRCRICREVRPLTDFYARGREHRCRPCFRIYLQERIREKTQYIQRVKVESGCMDCGFQSDHPEVFDLDHRPDEHKILPLSKLRLTGSMADVIAEIAKCDVVCANCHRVRTKLRGDSGKNANHDLRRGTPSALNVVNDAAALPLEWPPAA